MEFRYEFERPHETLQLLSIGKNTKATCRCSVLRAESAERNRGPLDHVNETPVHIILSIDLISSNDMVVEDRRGVLVADQRA